MLSHLEEAYVVPSLVAQACKEANLSQNITAAAFEQPAGVDVGVFLVFAREHVTKAVRNYLRRRLGLTASGGWGNNAEVRAGYAVR